MDEEILFNFLKKQNKQFLLELLHDAYEGMDTKQRRFVFGKLIKKAPSSKVDGKKLLDKIRKFHEESVSGYYYAPFEINSKNFSDIPEQTEAWFEKLGDLLQRTSRLTEQNEHSLAIECFSILFELIDRMGEGEEIIFADEYGTWMITCDDKIYISAYLSSLSAMSSSKEFAVGALPLIRRDSYESFVNRTYYSAINIANEEQKQCLETEVKKHKIETELKR